MRNLLPLKLSDESHADSTSIPVMLAWSIWCGPSVAACSGAGDTHLSALGAVDPAGVIGIARLAAHGSLPVRRAGELLRATPGGRGIGTRCCAFALHADRRAAGRVATATVERIAKAFLAAGVVLPLVGRA